MRLIIAEKPSLAKNIKSGADGSKFKHEDGYYINDKYIITWAFGHLFGLIDIEEYDPYFDTEDKKGWTLDNIPFFPEVFKFGLKRDAKTKRVDKGVDKQFNIIKSLINRRDVVDIVNAGDADREGQIIIDIILQHANSSKKPVYRLWLPDQTPETVSSQLKNMKKNDEYQLLANEGYARTFIDWLYGINLTRYSSVKGKTLLRVGRVVTPVVQAIYDRDMQIKNFVPEKYKGIISKEKTNGHIVELISKKTFKENEEADANALCKKYNKEKAVVSDVKKEKKTIAPGKLYSLSKLQGVLGREYKMSLKKSLSIIQSLYESGYVSYPRTNTEYLAEAEKDKTKTILSLLKKSGYPVSFRDSKTVFDDSKIESHSALTPTTKIPNNEDLSPDELKVYNAIKNRYIAVFCSEPCVVDRTTIKIDVGSLETFTLKGDIIKSKGWMAYDFSDKKDKILPDLNKGDIVNTLFKPVDKSTSPPKHYTVDSLNKFLKNPFKVSKEDINEEPDTDFDDEEYKLIMEGAELGTEATRSNIIEHAIVSGYISLKNNTYTILPDGIFYVETLKKLNVEMSKEKTVHTGKLLKDVLRGKSSIEYAVECTKKDIEEALKNKNISLDTLSVHSLGKCPCCEGYITKNAKGYGCSNYKSGCKFFIGIKIAHKSITENNVKELLKNGSTGEISGFKSSSGNAFSAKLKLEKVDDVVKCVFDFSKPSEPDISLSCPCCGSEIKSGKWAWQCSSDCGFFLNYKMSGKKMTIKNLQDIISKGETGVIKGFISKSGTPFNAKLVLDNKKIGFKF